MDSHDPSRPPSSDAGIPSSDDPAASSTGSTTTPDAASGATPPPPPAEPPQASPPPAAPPQAGPPQAGPPQAGPPQAGPPPAGFGAGGAWAAGGSQWNAAGPWPNGLRRLTRVRQGKMVAGVCTGVARSTGTDPILFRVILTVLVFFGGIGALLYLVAWVLLPLDDEPASPVESLLGRGRSGTAPAVTLGLIIVAALLLAGSLSSGFQGTVLLAACLIGGAMLLRRPGGVAGAGPAAPPPSPDAASGFSAPTAGPAASTHSMASTGATMGDSPATSGGPVSSAYGAPAAPSATATVPPPPSPSAVPTGPPTPPPYTPPFAPYGPYGSFDPGRSAPEFRPTPPVPAGPTSGRRRRKERSVLGRLTFSVACLALVVLAIIDAAGVSIPRTGYVALALLIVTLGVFVGVWVGRARGLIFLGILLSLVLGLSTVAEKSNGAGGFDLQDQAFTPTSNEEILADYQSGAGDFDLDLTNVDFTGVSRTVRIDSGVGDVRVKLPANVDVTVAWETGAGDNDVLGQQQSGLGRNGSVTDNGANGPDTSDLHLEIHHGAGDLEVSR